MACVPAHQCGQAIFAQEAIEGWHRAHFAWLGIIGHQWLAGGSVLNQLDDAEQPDCAHITNRWMAALDRLKLGFEDSAHPNGMFEQTIFFIDIYTRDCCRTANRMGVVG